MNLNEKYKTLIQKCGINTPLRLAHFFSQISHESGLKPISENLNYTAKRLWEIFPKYFPTTELCNKYQKNPESIANRVYANRMGNGNEASGDGWKYRGRGFIQITGKENYNSLCNDTGINCVDNPDCLLEEANAMTSALWFWNKKGLNELADIDNIETITKKINGGFNGLAHRKSLLIKWKQILKI